MPGVIRPYTLLDVLATINQNATGNATVGANTSAFGIIAEADESIPAAAVADAATAAVAATAGWDQGTWGGVGWH
jgi:hypothetical protein